MNLAPLIRTSQNNLVNSSINEVYHLNESKVIDFNPKNEQLQINNRYNPYFEDIITQLKTMDKNIEQIKKDLAFTCELDMKSIVTRCYNKVSSTQQHKIAEYKQILDDTLANNDLDDGKKTPLQPEKDPIQSKRFNTNIFYGLDSYKGELSKIVNQMKDHKLLTKEIESVEKIDEALVELNNIINKLNNTNHKPSCWAKIFGKATDLLHVLTGIYGFGYMAITNTETLFNTSSHPKELTYGNDVAKFATSIFFVISAIRSLAKAPAEKITAISQNMQETIKIARKIIDDILRVSRTQSQENNDNLHIRSSPRNKSLIEYFQNSQEDARKRSLEKMSVSLTYI